MDYTKPLHSNIYISKGLKLGYQIQIGDIDPTISAVEGMIAWDDVNLKVYTGSGGWVNTTMTSINVDLIPDTDNTYDIGSSTHGFKDIYFDGSLMLDSARSLTVDSSNNIYLGLDAGEVGESATENIAIGSDTGTYITTGSTNVYIGHNVASGASSNGANNVIVGHTAGAAIESNNNVLLGKESGYGLTSGGTNTIVGTGAGYTISAATGNVFLGYQAGYSETASNKLYIANSNTASPLLYGDFNTGEFVVNGNITTTGNFTVQGTLTTINTEDLLVKDSIIELNFGATGTPAAWLQSGIKINRGDEDPFVFVFDETADTFRIGSGVQQTDGTFVDSDLQAVATREDSPVDGGLAFYVTSNVRFDTYAGLTFDSSNNLSLGSAANRLLSLDINVTNASMITDIVFDSSGISLIATNSTYTNFVMDHQTMTITSDYGTFTGLEYAANYRSNFGSETLIDVGYLGVIAVDVKPSTPNTRDLGATSYEFKDAYLSGTIEIGGDLITFSGSDFLKLDNSTSISLGIGTGVNVASGGNDNVLIGSGSGAAVTTGDNNIFIGHDAGIISTTSNGDIAIGYRTLGYDGSFTTLGENVAIGDYSGGTLGNGSYNLFLGAWAGYSMASGEYNTIIGYEAGQNSSTGSNNVFIGRGAGENESTSNKLYISNTNTATPLLYGEFDNAYLKVNNRLEVEEEITVGTIVSGTSLTAGMIQWDGNHFQGYDGSEWLNLDIHSSYEEEVGVNSDGIITVTVPAKHRITSIVVLETASFSPGDFSLGTSALNTDIINALNIGSDALVDCAIGKEIFSMSSLQNLYASASDWGSGGTVTIYFKFTKFAK